MSSAISINGSSIKEVMLMANQKRAGVFFRKNRQRWGYKVYRQGLRFERYAWETEAQAQAALNRLDQDLKEQLLPPTALESAIAAYITDSSLPEHQRSLWRLDGLRFNFKGVIIPF